MLPAVLVASANDRNVLIDVDISTEGYSQIISIEGEFNKCFTSLGEYTRFFFSTFIIWVKKKKILSRN